MPFQCLKRSGDVLFAATGACLDTFNISTASRTSRWSYTSEGDSVVRAGEVPNLLSQKSETSSIDIVLDSEPPTKKRRLSSGSEVDESIVEQKAPRRRQRRPPITGSTANIVALTCTNDGKHVIIVTGEDKTIRVLEHDLNGLLRQLSARAMPKRPCAIALTANDSTVICADKFGDVYSIPLIETPIIASDSKIRPEKPDAEPKTFIPSATTLTVHSERNRRALEQQRKQVIRNSDRQEIKFEHKLLLGHVSMLTDIAVATHGSQNYIITADRDEHIRISRGIPQAHIIENYCLGHTEFVSRICLPSSVPNLLISGGGEDEIYVWEWRSGILLNKISARPFVGIDEDAKIVFSGIHEVNKGNANDPAMIAVTCEATPAILMFSITSQGEVQYHETLRVEGNVLDIAADATSGNMMVSIDLIHEAGSITTVRHQVQAISNDIVSFDLDPTTRSWQKQNISLQTVSDITEDITGLSNVLYGLSNLRKRAGENDEDL